MPGSFAFALGIQVDNDAASLDFGDMPVFAPGSFEPVCGDGIRDPLEGCDGTDFGQATCASLNVGTGTLTCTVGCTIDTANCTAGSSSSSSSSSSSTSSSSAASSATGGLTGGGSGGGSVTHSSQSSSATQSSTSEHSSASSVQSSSSTAQHSASSVASSSRSVVIHASSASSVHSASGEVLFVASSSAMFGAGTASQPNPDVETMHGAAPVVSEAWRLVLAGGVGVLLFLATAGRPMFWFAVAKRRKHRAIDRRPATFSSRRVSTR